MSGVIPYGRHDLNDADIEAVVAVLRSEWLTQGQSVPRFEEALVSHCGAQYAVAANSATSALHVACLALGLGPGDWLWTSPTTFVASANGALCCGAKVDFVDIDPFTYNMSVERLASKLADAERAGRLPKIVMPVHLCGQSCDMAAIAELGRRYGFKIVEDASHSIGARYKNEPVGSCRFSDIVVFSFHPVKIVTTGEGGAALTNDPELARQMRLYRSHGITNDRSRFETHPGYEIWNYEQIALGFNYRMTDIQAALGVSQLFRLDELVTRRRDIARRYDAELANLPVTLPWQSRDSLSSYHLYPIRVRRGECGKTQREVYEALVAAGIGVNLHYIPVYRQPYYQRQGFSAGYCAEAESYFHEAMTIPLFPALSEAGQRRVIDAVKGALTS
jgi:UDP-4-amino-4,6-dideoxy-N-acetyl-beta-L-altrosamine transaminase